MTNSNSNRKLRHPISIYSVMCKTDVITGKINEHKELVLMCYANITVIGGKKESHYAQFRDGVVYRLTVRHHPRKKIESGMHIIWHQNNEDVIMIVEEVVPDTGIGQWLFIEAIA